MRHVRVIDLECELYPLNQVHVPADSIDIVEGLWVVRAAPRAIAVRKDPARRAVGVCAVVHHPEQELGDGCNPAAPRADPEVKFLLQTPAGVRAEDRRVLGELSGLIERLGEIGRADETREYSRRNRAKTRSDSSSVVSSRCPNSCLLIRMGFSKVGYLSDFLRRSFSIFFNTSSLSLSISLRCLSAV